jgi:hypothetical protein
MRIKKKFRWQAKKTFVALTLLLLFSTFLSQICQAADKTPYQDFTSGEDNEGSGMLVDQLIRAIFIYGVTGLWMLFGGISFSEHFREVIVANPSFSPMSPSYNSEMTNLVYRMVYTLDTLYILAIVIIGVYMMFLSGSPEGKARAKNLLKRVILSMILFTLSPLVLELMLVSSQSLSAAFMDSMDMTAAKEVLQGGLWGSYWIFSKIGMTSLELSGGFWTSLYAMAWLPYILISLRYILVVFFCIAFPLGVILYSFEFMRGLGRQILEQTILWIYMQVFLSLAMVAIALSISFYGILPAGQDQKLSGINFGIPAMGGPWGALIAAGITLLIPVLTSFLANFFDSTVGATSILRFTLGAASYALLIAVPFLMMRIMHDFLP